MRRPSIRPLRRLTSEDSLQEQHEKQQKHQRRRRRIRRFLKTNMRRVSSRQRLVSWDAFDASINIEEDGNEDNFVGGVDTLSPNNSSSSNSNLVTTYYEDRSPFLRKRVRVERQSHTSATSPFSTSYDDVKLYITSFLSVNEARSFMSVNKHMNQLVRENHFLWKAWCFQQWPHLSHSRLNFLNESYLDYSTILHRAIAKPPTHVDPSTLVKRRHTVFTSLHDDSNKHNSNDKKTTTTTTPTIVQFQGQVGSGDRCFRANQALARPPRRKEDKNNKQPNFFKLLQRRVVIPPPSLQPFCAPFVHNDRLCLLPRLVSYFEITIQKDGPAVNHHDTTHGAAAPPPTPPLLEFNATPPAVDCIAIGVSLQDFSITSRMPGWDRWSYGYHGDDGGIFHASGDMLKSYGPSFGKGDTVGCGIDYRNEGSIFFTLNGKFLGHAWVGMDNLSLPLIPTIGVDSNAPIRCNFGHDNFTFDLVTYMTTERRDDEIASS